MTSARVDASISPRLAPSAPLRGGTRRQARQADASAISTPRSLRRRSRSTRPTTTADESHAMMEPYASIAAWDGDKLTVWTSNQMIDWAQDSWARSSGSTPRTSASTRPTSAAASAESCSSAPMPCSRRGCERSRAPGQDRAAASAHRQQHDASAGHHPAHAHRRRARRQDHRDRARELVGQPQRRGWPRTAPTRRPSSTPARTAWSPTTLATLDLPEGNAMRAPGEAPGRWRWKSRWMSWPKSSASIRSNCACATTRTGVPGDPTKPFSTGTWCAACAKARSASAGIAVMRNRRRSATATGWSAWACRRAIRGADHQVRGARPPGWRRAGHGRNRHDRHRHRQLHDPRADRGGDAWACRSIGSR